MILIDRVRRHNLRRKYRDDVVSRISKMRDSGYSTSRIAHQMNLPESTVRRIIKHFL